MIHDLTQPFVYSFLSASGEEVTGQTPTCRIKNVDKSLYWDGIDWQTEAIELAMTHSSNGVYKYTVEFEEKGNYLVSAYDSINEQSDEIELEVISGAVAGLSQIYTHQKTMAQDKVVKVSVQRVSDGYFFNNVGWQLTETMITMTQSSPGTYEYPFTYPTVETFIFRTTEETTAVDESKNVNFRANTKELKPNLLGSTISGASIVGTEGTDSIVLNHARMPIKDVDVLAYNKATKEFYKCKTDMYGRWRLMVSPATYVIIFKKDTYIHTSIERAVT